MNEGEIIIYLGTTVESYQRLSSLSGATVVFNKRREPRMNHPGFYHEDEFDPAAIEAFCRAGADGVEFQIPLVLEGYAHRDRVNSINRSFFPVERVWRIKQDVDWGALLTTPIPQRGELNQYFDALDAKVFLEEVKK